MPGGGFYLIEVANPGGGTFMCNATLCGKMKVHKIRVTPGDAVKVAVSPYDFSKGRIMTRVRGA
jgi:translation initiation factor IF-1